MGIGGDHERAHGSIRFTFGRFNTISEVDDIVGTLAEIVKELRIISPLGKGKMEDTK
jgi:cysteine desulfurase